VRHPGRAFGLLGAAALLLLAGWATVANVGLNPREIAAVAGDANDTTAEESELSVNAASPYAWLVELPPLMVAVGSDGAITRRALIRTTIPQRPPVVIVKYQVEQGDTLFGIADEFGLKPETVLWGNFHVLQDNPHSLRPGQELNILPVDGTYYEWSQGDELNGVAAFFGVTAQDIFDWPGNNLPQDIDPANPGIEPGTGLVIPGGRRDFVTWSAPRITRANPAVARLAGPGACGSVSGGPIGEGAFIWPTTATNLSGTPFTSYHPGIDIAGSTGNAIYASASGVVVYAGWSDHGYGLMVVIDHGDGWQTLYAHMNTVDVACGQTVFQGNVIGGVGSTGNSTGAHLHFEMQHDLYGKVNPFEFVSP
jgi:murein DD-endopeptidase MepM/ murein hydrolase activator NlpD